MTKVSIITPTYNPSGEAYIESKISIEAQTSKDFEWIVVDDGSTNYNGWAFVRTEKNFGPSVARNIGFQVSSGDIITYLDIGDILSPTRVENLIDMYSQWDIEMTFSAYDIVQGDIIQKFNHFNYIGKQSSALDVIHLLKNQNISIPLGVSHIRRPFVEVGGFQRGIVCGEDGVLWRRMADKIHPTKILFSDDFAGTYYVNPHGQSRTQRRFEMGGFAIDGELMDNGRYLDNSWFESYSSKGYYE